MQKPPKGPDAIPVAEEFIGAKVGIDLRDVFTLLENRAAELLADGQQRGLTGQALADFVDEGLRGLSSAPIEQAGRASTAEAYNLGRNIEAQRREPEIGLAVRSAILDVNTCVNCRALDGATAEINGPVVFISSAGRALLEENGVDPSSDDAYFALMPPNFCNGEDFCRDEYIYRRAAA